MEVGEFADSIKDRITSFNSLALAQSLRSHAFCKKKKKTKKKRHFHTLLLCIWKPQVNLSTSLHRVLFLSSTLTNTLKWKGLLKKGNGGESSFLLWVNTLWWCTMWRTHTAMGSSPLRLFAYGTEEKKKGWWGGAGWRELVGGRGGRKVRACFF